MLFISLDDLNDWIGCLGGHPQARTPNIDRLAASGVLFSNAHCPAPACNPSRTAIMTGLSPHRSGLYANGQNMREVLQEEDKDEVEEDREEEVQEESIDRDSHL